MSAEREAYVKLQLMKSFMAEHRERQLVAAGSTLLLAAISWRYSRLAPLLAWLAAAALVAPMHLIAATSNSKRFSTAHRQAAQSAFSRRIGPLWVATAVVWGTSVLLFFDRMPIGQEFVCWMILAGTVTFPIYRLALHPPVLRQYVNTLFVVMLGCVAYRLGTSSADHRYYEPWFLTLPIIHWLLLFRISGRIHANARRGFELEFHKYELIKTLGDKRHEAEAAVAVKNRFIATAAHDLRQPVLAISLYADHLVEMPEEYRTIVPKIAKAAAAINRLFDSLFDMARMENGQTKLRISTIDISEILHDLLVQTSPWRRQSLSSCGCVRRTSSCGPTRCACDA
ncbi:hypothetical protein LJR084_007625 [Variovorax sp. LjRoot84]|uniref:sensor histidine kinase n=1 Tax=Variovorax sp. LjRoot84 TaxID=3342340 RepID=UPI003ED121FD